MEHNRLPALSGGTTSSLGQEPFPTGGRWCCLLYHAGAVFASLLIRLWRIKMQVRAKNQLTGVTMFTHVTFSSLIYVVVSYKFV